MITPGKLIALYGINNVGKTTQAKLLANRISSAAWNIPTPASVKYARYDISPSGPLINNYLRLIGGKKNPYGFSPREFQILQAFNRTQAESSLFAILDSGISVVAEDYTGTGIAWGIGAGVSKDFLVEINRHLVKEDLAILLDGERFLSGKEENHSHEEDDKLVQRVRQIHLDLAKEFGWHVVAANQSQERVHADIWHIVRSVL